MVDAFSPSLLDPPSDDDELYGGVAGEMTQPKRVSLRKAGVRRSQMPSP